LAAILLAAFLFALLIASLFPQLPADLASRPSWLAAVALRYRGATGLLRALGWFDVYYSAWFLALLAALLLNTLLCTIQRLPRLWRSLTQAPQVTQSDAFFDGFARRAEWTLASPQAGLAAVRQALTEQRYRTYVETDQAAGRANLHAERCRWARAGTALSHLAVLLLLAAILARPALGWQQTGVTLLPGQVHSIEREPALAVRTGPLAIDRHSDGQPRRYQVPLAILADGSPVMTQTVGINHPLSYGGIVFHLTGYGPAAQITTPAGRIDLPFNGGQSGDVRLPGTGTTLRLAHQSETGALFVEARAADGTLLGSGTVADGEELVVEGMPITFALGHYTTWQVSHDPTFGLAIAAAGLFLVGMVVTLAVPHRRLWLRVDGQHMQMVGAGRFDGEFEAITATVARRCHPEGEAHGH
jgi:cytochrome c biogenesis protein